MYSLLREGHVVAVFYRGGWCPYCNLHLRGYRRRLAHVDVDYTPRLDPDDVLETLKELKDRNHLETNNL